MQTGPSASIGPSAKLLETVVVFPAAANASSDPFETELRVPLETVDFSTCVA